MTRLRTTLLLGAMVLAIVMVFVYDTVRAVVDLDLMGLLILRELLIVAVVLAGYWLLGLALRGERKSIAKEIGRLTIGSAGAIFLLGAMLFFGPAKGTRTADLLPQDSVFGVLRGVTLGVILGGAALWTIQSLRQIVLFKRRKESQRNVIIYLSLLGTTAAASSPVLPLEGSFVLPLFVPLTILAAIVLSFRQNWIVYLSRREKLYTLLYAFLSFLFGLLTVVLIAQDHPVIIEFQQFSRSIYILVQQTAVLSTIYFGMAFISTLFHMPTAEVFERKQSELSSLHNLTRLTSQLLDFDTLVQTVTQMAQEVCGAKAVWLELLAKAPDGSWSTQVVAHRDISLAEVDEVRVALGSSYRDLVVEARSVVLVDDGPLISVPLTARKELIGILHAAREMTQGFDQDDIDVLSSFGDHVTIAIENARLISRSIERERLQQELLVARRMQRQLLPSSVPQLERASFSASSESSTEVGGDYYDLVELGRDRWGIAVGDVSGKGVSAAFYMAEVKGIVLSLSRVCSSPKELLVRANEALHGSLERKAFVSLVYAVLNERTGDLISRASGSGSAGCGRRCSR